MYGATAAASMYQQYGGASYWYTAGSGTAGNPISFTQAMTLDASGNLAVGTTTQSGRFDVKISGVDTKLVVQDGFTSGNLRLTSATETYSAYKNFEISSLNTLFYTNGSERARIDSNGYLFVGTTSSLGSYKLQLNATGSTYGFISKTDTTASTCGVSWNAATTGDNSFALFGTEASFTTRGSITYNRAGGLTAYNTTSDYRAKDISGPVTDSGVLIDSTPVYMGKMKGATQERPMFIAHEVPVYAHTGEKDAVDADGNPVYQQMDASALIPVMWAEIQSLRKRLADAGIA